MLLGGPGLCASQAAAAAAAQSEGDHDRPGELWRWQRATGEDMDESSLLDLLECSVCLERLDTTAKVLPCQHTFCRRCLESILCSRRELRCPECRILVGCGVDELPANILLVRLLDGIRQRPRAGASPGGSPPAPSGPGWGAASELAGGGGRAMGSAPGSPVFPLEAGSPHELTTSRNAPLAKVPVPGKTGPPACLSGQGRLGRGRCVTRQNTKYKLFNRREEVILQMGGVLAHLFLDSVCWKPWFSPGLLGRVAFPGSLSFFVF
uniref:SH3 domain containing ring finger 3 n=1 Tax=Pipistrellus kuhlii TaxID=59472 RepID=A0A7J8AAV2_PIPKU|nr:SH3 domain containing ring finger 3 [Pipistrellus kuhlii]